MRSVKVQVLVPVSAKSSGFNGCVSTAWGGNTAWQMFSRIIHRKNIL